MSNVGFGIGAAIGVAAESTEGTPVAPSLYLPFVSESLKAQRPLVKQGTITGDRSNSKMLDGVRSGAGDITQEVDGSTNVQLAIWANGKASGATSSANIPGRISSAPSATPAAGGSLTAGAYRYKVASVWERDATGELFVLPASAEVTGTTASSDLTIDLGWTAPSGLTPPEGWSYAGTAIYRSEAGGAADSQKFLHYVSGTGASWSDTGSVTLGTKVPVAPASAMRSHTLVKAFATGAHPLQAFTTVINKDNDQAIRFKLCRAAALELVIGENASVVTQKLSVLARDWDVVANVSPTVTALRKMMSWGVTVKIDGADDETVRGCTINLNNNAALRPGLSGQPRMLDVGYGMRDISGSLPRSYNDQDFVAKLYAAQRFAIDAWLVGQAIVETDSEIPISAGVTARPIPYMARIEVPSAALNEAGANASGPGEMVENLTWSAELDATEGTDLRMTWYNLTASY